MVMEVRVRNFRRAGFAGGGWIVVLAGFDEEGAGFYVPTLV